jgi:site-specific DNA-cytosine methylase
MKTLTTLELCAGAGGQALGLEQAGIEHVALVEWDRHACNTLRVNRPEWNVIQGDIREFDASPYRGVDIVSGGLPCPPFSVAGKLPFDRKLLNHGVKILSWAWGFASTNAMNLLHAACTTPRMQISHPVSQCS